MKHYVLILSQNTYRFRSQTIVGYRKSIPTGDSPNGCHGCLRWLKHFLRLKEWQDQPHEPQDMLSVDQKIVKIPKKPISGRVM